MQKQKIFTFSEINIPPDITGPVIPVKAYFLLKNFHTYKR